MPATRLANLSPSACRQELRQRALPVTPHKTNTPGIAYALRFAGPFGGVTFVAPGAPSPYGLFDCRMALALDEMAGVLAAHDVAEVHVGNMYRKRAYIAGRRRRRSQHSYGLALDMTAFRLRDGRLLQVERDFHGTLGDRACGPTARVHDPSESSIALRNVVCAVVRAGIFHHVLTPCGDAAHRNHLHFDIKRGAKYQRLR
ncbi:MAG: extensin family protein [Deltaproteobacteria bacterium]|jgi:hypothetical protein|nr:extensin family protein [Deltaproteobacteria bacterium]MBW2534188.1 extensin family protein [Deltaproteobacteria bacterium]